MERQVGQIIYNNRVIDVHCDSNMVIVYNKDQVTQFPLTNTILDILRNEFDQDYIYSVQDLLLFVEQGICVIASDHAKESVLDSKWSSHVTPFQLFLN